MTCGGRSSTSSGRRKARLPRSKRKSPRHRSGTDLDIYRHDDGFRARGFGLIAGIDEAGRGPLAGPVVAAAVILPPGLVISGLRDSKKVPHRRIPLLFEEILVFSSAIGVGIVGSEEIDASDILTATKKAMATAVSDLRLKPDALIIDAVSLPSVTVKQFPIVKADAKSASVAAASIVAKHVRDMMMLHYHELYPLYGFDRHKGYCTTDHVQMISRHGPCPIHRLSFRKVTDQQLPF